MRMRTLKNDIPEKVQKVNELKKTLTLLSACKQVGMSYRTYIKYRESSTTSGLSPEMMKIFEDCVKALQIEVAKDLLTRLEKMK